MVDFTYPHPSLQVVYSTFLRMVVILFIKFESTPVSVYVLYGRINYIFGPCKEYNDYTVT